jgi:hypothetical protein
MSARRFAVALAAVVLGSSLALAGIAGGASSSIVKPRAGYWHVTYFSHGSGSGTSGSFKVMKAGFTVSSNHKNVSRFSYSFQYSGPIKPPSGVCSGNGVTTAAKGSAIKKRKFSTASATSWSGAGSATYHGTFDSARRAHGTAVFQVFIGGAGCQFSGNAQTGTVNWRATR